MVLKKQMAKDSKEIANMMLTPSVLVKKSLRFVNLLLAAKMLEVVSSMNVVENDAMYAKMRARRTMATSPCNERKR